MRVLRKCKEDDIHLCGTFREGAKTQSGNGRESDVDHQGEPRRPRIVGMDGTEGISWKDMNLKHCLVSMAATGGGLAVPPSAWRQRNNGCSCIKLTPRLSMA